MVNRMEESNKNVTIIMGYPAAGKTVISKSFEEVGYYRLNRDDIGGTLDNLVNHLDRLYNEEGISKFVMDNTYAKSIQRKTIINWAKSNKFEVDCKWINLDIGDALYNASKRMIDNYGKLLMPDEIKKSKDSSIYPPVVIYKIKKNFEVPTTQEGFNNIRMIKFKRNLDKLVYNNKAIILDYDGTLRKTISGEKYPKKPNDIEILPSKRKEVLKRYQDEGYFLLGASNQSFVAKKELTIDQTVECFERTNELLGIDIDYTFCPHQAYPYTCYCRKPLPGLGVAFIEKYKLDPSQSIMVGDQKSDSTFAERCGFKFINSDKFFEQTL